MATKEQSGAHFTRAMAQTWTVCTTGIIVIDPHVLKEGSAMYCIICNTVALCHCIYLSPRKWAFPHLRGFPHAEMVPRAAGATQTSEAVMAHIYTLHAPILTRFFQAKHSSPITITVVLLGILQVPLWQPAEGRACSFTYFSGQH